jgi:hypothetical protein
VHLPAGEGHEGHNLLLALLLTCITIHAGWLETLGWASIRDH